MTTKYNRVLKPDMLKIRLLRVLLHSQKPLTIKEIAAHLGTPPSNLTTYISEWLTERKISASDDKIETPTGTKFVDATYRLTSLGENVLDKIPGGHAPC